MQMMVNAISVQYIASWERNIWRFLLYEDEAVISGGPRMDIAKQELEELEDCINYASFISAAGVSNPQPIDDWISGARKTAFCLADQIAMYATRGSSNSQLYHMKSNIGMFSIGELTTRSEGYKVVGEEKGQMPPAVQRSSDSMPQLSEISPFIRYSRPVSADAMIRMDDKIKKVESFLTGTHPVLFITGGQGSGKTTLMKDLYASQKQKLKPVHGQTLGENDFNQCCWVDITKTRGLVSLLKMLLKESNIDCDSIHEFEIMKTVHDNFKDNHYLIVLDNVQHTSVLYNLKSILHNFKWKIICLTRRRDIQKDDNQDVLHIPGLEPYDSFKLFLSAAFSNFQSPVLPTESFNSTMRDDVLRDAIRCKDELTSRSLLATELVKMVKLLNVILSKCQNNPWNIWSIGTLLDANPLAKWEEIGERIDGMLIDGTKIYEKRDPPIQLEDAKLADPAIRQCFLYCLAFPEPSETGIKRMETSSEMLENSGGIPARKLIRLWTAEGYVQDSPRQSQEQEAECLLKELIKKNLLVVKKTGFDGEVLKCSVNEHIRPLAEKMCEQQKFCKVVLDDADEACLPRRMTKCFPISHNIRIRERKTLSDRYRMLAVHGDRGVKEVSKTLGKDIRLRSLLYFKTGRIEHSELELSFCRTYMLLRTLELQGARLASLPPNIDCLVCLRYLGLRNTQLEDLPPTLERLTHLMCLDIRDTNIAEVADVSQFREMRHLYLTNSFRSHSVVIREGLQSLIHLQTLSGAAYGESSVRQSSGMVPFEQEISHLRRLRKLSMKKTSSTSSKNICDAINGIESLQSLAISCDRDGQQFDLSPLKIGKNLRKLKLGGPMGNFCDLGPLMQSITYLYLWNSKLPIDILDTLQGLKNLLVLSLLNASSREKMNCNNGYEKLKKLSILSMENLSECEFGRNVMGNLEELVFAKCGNLKYPPTGLDQLVCLREVHLTEMLPDFCKEARDILKDKVYVLADALSHVVLKIPSHA
ncbi:unnamed protein product [Alopecurus aequalis]